MLFDAASRAHARAGHDDAGPLDGVDGLGFLARSDELQARKIEGLLSRPEQASGSLRPGIPGDVSKTSVTSTAMGLSRKTRTGGMQFLLPEPAEMEHQLLGPFDGERGDDDVAADATVSATMSQSRFSHVLRVLVVPVAVGRLHDDIIRPCEDRRVPDDRLVPLADVPGKDEGPGFASVLPARTSIMDDPRMCPASWNVTETRSLRAAGGRIGSSSTRGRVRSTSSTCTGGPLRGAPVAPPSVALLLEGRVFLLDPGGVAEDDGQEVGRGRGRQDRARKSPAGRGSG